MFSIHSHSIIIKSFIFRHFLVSFAKMIFLFSYWLGFIIFWTVSWNMSFSMALETFKWFPISFIFSWSTRRSTAAKLSLLLINFSSWVKLFLVRSSIVLIWAVVLSFRTIFSSFGKFDTNKFASHLFSVIHWYSSFSLFNSCIIDECERETIIFPL